MSFRKTYHKDYSSLSDLKYRLDVYKKHLKEIENHNKDKTSTYTLGVNEFTDWSFDEFQNKFLGEKLKNSIWDKFMSWFYAKAKSTLWEAPLERKNEKVDWSQDPTKVGPVRQQGSCGSCWAFAAADATAQALAILYNQPLETLSPQELVSCNKDGINEGCNGGHHTIAWNYIRKYGLSTESSYPYFGQDGVCQHEKTGSGQFKVQNWKSNLVIGPEPVLEFLKVNTATLALHVQSDFQYYKSGIYNPSTCRTKANNHVVSLVGYDLTSNIPHFIIQNSWGRSWGESGRMRLAIATNGGICGCTEKYSVHTITA